MNEPRKEPVTGEERQIAAYKLLNEAAPHTVIRNTTAGGKYAKYDDGLWYQIWGDQGSDGAPGVLTEDLPKGAYRFLRTTDRSD